MSKRDQLDQWKKELEERDTNLTEKKEEIEKKIEILTVRKNFLDSKLKSQNIQSSSPTIQYLVSNFYNPIVEELNELDAEKDILEQDLRSIDFIIRQL